MRFLSDEWVQFRFRKLEGLRVAPGVDLSVQHVISDGPAGEVRYYDQVRDGSLVKSAMGEVEEPDFILTRAWVVDRGLHCGEIDPYTALVEGHVTLTGDEVRMLTLLPLLQDYSAQLESVARDLAAATGD